MTCNFCLGPTHESVACIYGPRTASCIRCTRSFWAWVIRHTNGKARKGSTTARTFYEHAGDHRR